MRFFGTGMGIAVAVAALAASGGCKSNSISANDTTNNAGNVIGPAGGVVNGPNGSQVRIPANALQEDTTINVTVADPSAYPPSSALPAGVGIAGQVYAFEPHGLKFFTPVIIDLPPQAASGAVGLQAEQGAAAWTEVAGTFNATTAEISTGSFSFYAVGTPASGTKQNGDSCSGRGPVAGAPTATLSGMSGTIAASGSQPAVDLATVVDGWAMQEGGSGPLVMSFTSYAQACGYVQNGDYKIGAASATLEVIPSGSTIGVGTYAGTSIGAGTNAGIAAGTPPGACSVGANPAAGGSGTTGPGITITAIDATHVAGSFDFTPGGGGELKGTFSLPFCVAPTTLQPPSCCLP